MSVPFPQGRGLRQGDPLIHVYPDLDTLSDGPRSTSWSNVLVKDTYIFDHDNGTLRRKPLLSRSRHRNKLLKYFELLNSGIMTETDIFKQFKRPPARPPDDSQLIYFRRPDPHFHQILQSFLHDGTALVSLSTKWFRTLQLDPLEILPDHYLTGLVPFPTKHAQYSGVFIIGSSLVDHIFTGSFPLAFRIHAVHFAETMKLTNTFCGLALTNSLFGLPWPHAFW